MGKNTGFMEFTRELPERRAVEERVKDWFEIYKEFPLDKVRTQGARCMDCGVPFCHTGCPLNNIIPDWNDLVYKQDWKRAIDVLHQRRHRVGDVAAAGLGTGRVPLPAVRSGRVARQERTLGHRRRPGHRR